MPASVRISAQFPFPAGVAGTTPIAITKANGIWSVALPLDALATQNPSGGNLTTDYLLVWDSLTGTYFKMPVSNVPTGAPGPPGPPGATGPAGGITDAPSDGVNYGRKNAAWNNLDTIYAPIAAISGSRSYLAGLTLSTSSAAATFGIAPGVAADSTNTTMMTLAAAITTKGYSAWALGSGAGSLDTGAGGSANTFYHVYLIKRLDTGVVDVAISLSASAPTFGVNIPAAYTLFRRIGSIRIGASNLVGYTQNGDHFRWSQAVRDLNATNPGTTGFLPTLTVPPGIVVEADISVLIANATSTTIYILLTSTTETDRVPSGSDCNFGISVAGTQFCTPIRGVFTNTSTQIRVRCSASGVSDVLNIMNFGWIDRRGRDA
jgi:hypothetical protein